MAFLWRAYTRVMNAHPFKTQVSTTGVIMLFSDILVQQGIERRGLKKHNFKRTLLQSLLGFAYVGPSLTLWYRAVDGLFKGTPAIAVLKKVAADQLLFAPPFIASFFVVNGILMGVSMDNIKKRLSQNYVSTVITNYKIWPAVQLCNFYLVPLYYRVLVAQLVAVFWNTYLIYKVNEDTTVGTEDTIDNGSVDIEKH